MRNGGGWDVARALSLVATDIPSPLIAKGAFSNLKRAAAQLPAGFSAALLESRLDEPGQTDLLVCATRRGSGQQDWTGDLAGGGKGRAFAASVLRDWSCEGSVLHRISPLVWLEFDDVGRRSALPQPSACVCLERQYLHQGQFGKRRAADWAGVLDAVLSMTSCPAYATRAKASVVRTLRQLPPGGRAIHLSIMAGRRPAAAKLYARVPRAKFFKFLRSIRWPGDAGPVEEYLLTAPLPDPKDLYVDLAWSESGVLPQIGLAFPAPPVADRFDRLLFEHSASTILDDRARETLGVQLRQWGRLTRTQRNRNARPWWIHRWVDQKFVFRPGKRRQHKLYLGLRALPSFFAASSLEDY
jgi:hypothetical protein